MFSKISVWKGRSTFYCTIQLNKTTNISFIKKRGRGRGKTQNPTLFVPFQSYSLCCNVFLRIIRPQFACQTYDISHQVSQLTCSNKQPLSPSPSRIDIGSVIVLLNTAIQRDGSTFLYALVPSVSDFVRNEWKTKMGHSLISEEKKKRKRKRKKERNFTSEKEKQAKKTTTTNTQTKKALSSVSS